MEERPDRETNSRKMTTDMTYSDGQHKQQANQANDGRKLACFDVKCFVFEKLFSATHPLALVKLAASSSSKLSPFDGVVSSNGTV